MSKWLKLFLVLLCALPISAQSYQYGLTGIIQGPDGKPVNGVLTIQLVRPTVIDTCATGKQIVPLSIQPAVLKIVNGVIQGASGSYSLAENNVIIAAINGLFGVNGSTISGSGYTLEANASVVGSGIGSLQLLSNDCMSPQIPYWISISDNQNNLIYEDNWYIPKMDGVNIDVGTMSEVSFGGPIVVSIPNAIVGTPASGQVINQPGVTYLSVNNLVVTNSFIASHIIAGNVTGNAGTATALAAVPTQCPGGYFSNGIQANGNANCSNSFPSNSVYSTLQWTSLSSSYPTQGGYLNWNKFGSLGVGGVGGETDFINAYGGGSGGFQWANVADGGTLGAGNILMTLSPVAGGTLSVTNMSTSFLTVGSSITTPQLYGNASTATMLNGSPAQCGSTQTMNGINANGDANCTSSTDSLTTNGFHKFSSGLIMEWGVTGDLGGGTQTISFPLPFPHQCFTVVATTVSSTDRILNISSWSTGYFVVSANGSSASASWTAYGY